MKSPLIKAFAVAILASGLATQAYAEHPTSTQGKRIEAQDAYWKAHPQSGGSAQAINNDYPMTRQQRLAQSNAEYFAAKGGSGSSGMVSSNPDYQFVTTHSQRIAKSNYDYFNKK